MISESMECCKLEQMSDAVFELKEQLYEARRHGEALHVVERDIVRVWLQKVGLLAVEGFIDCRYSAREPLVEFSWQGHDDGDDACGRGWAIVETDGKLRGRIFIHRGDDSGFIAKPA